jgi:MYXO-CTERM domain-containing protein
MDWTGTIDDGTFDYDGFFPDGVVDFHYEATGYTRYDTFGQARAAHADFEPHGLLLTAPIFANGLTAPADYTTALQPQDVTLASGSNAIDKGLVLTNVNDGYTGVGPDLGAYETGCAIPIYGPRSVGTDETNEPVGCGSPAPDGGVGGASGSGGASGGAGASSAGTAGTAGSTSGGAGGTSAGASGAGAASGSSGTAGSNGGANGGNGTSGTSGTSGSTATPGAESGDSGGCGCRTSHSGTSNAAVLLAIAAALGIRRRRTPKAKIS